MDLLQKAISLGFVADFETEYIEEIYLLNKDHYLWKIQKWLREVHNLSIHVFLAWKAYGYTIHHLDVESILEDASTRVYHRGDFKTYESALEHSLIEALKLIP